MNVLITVVSILLLYTYLRLKGGKGFSVIIKAEPLSTKQGKLDLAVMALCVMAIILASIGTNGGGITALVLGLGALVFLLAYLDRRRIDRK